MKNVGYFVPIKGRGLGGKVGDWLNYSFIQPWSWPRRRFKGEKAKREKMSRKNNLKKNKEKHMMKVF